MTKIRISVTTDLPRVVEMLKSFHSDKVKEFGLGLNEDHVVQVAKAYIDGHMGIVAEVDDDVVGMLGGALAPNPLDQDELMFFESVWYVDKGYRHVGPALLKECEARCKEAGVKHICMMSMAGKNTETLEKFYERKGYKPMETYYIKEIA